MKNASILLLSLLFAILLTSCEDGTVTPINPTNGIVIVTSEKIDTAALQGDFGPIGQPGGEYDLFELRDDVDAGSKPGGPYLLWSNYVKYRSTNNKGAATDLSGRLFYPFKTFGGKIKAPLVLFQHGTKIPKHEVPSEWSIFRANDLAYVEATVGAIFSSFNGWIVAMPDHPGMGADFKEYHPYCVKTPLEKSTADLLDAMVTYLKSGQNGSVEWNGQIFLAGYSEGAYITLAALMEIEKRGKHTVTGTVIMDGPYDLTGAMMDVMLGDAPFKVPYFLPYLVMGYWNMYGDPFNPNNLLKPEYSKTLIRVTDGYHATDSINYYMPADRILKNIFAAQYLDSLRNPVSRQNNILSQNNLWQYPAPKSKMYVGHYPYDDCVVFGNFQTLKNKFGTPPNITYDDFPNWPIVTDWAGSIHASFALTAFLKTALWIRAQE